MNVLIYCQHVLGIGHLFRTLAIAQALREDDVTLVLGGPKADISFPDHVRVVQLPPLEMDSDFSALHPVETESSLARIKETRKKQLLALYQRLQPEILLIELFPFGRYAFRFELDPLLKRVKEQNPSCLIACSVRDILVERDNQLKFEQRVIDRLNCFFHLLLIHGDPHIVPLDATFSRMDDINIPRHYTGYIAQGPAPGDRVRIRSKHRFSENERLIVASAGGGHVGYTLLHTTLQAFHLLSPQHPLRLQLFTGPFLAEKKYRSLCKLAGAGISIDRFTNDLPAWLAAADLSISMGGYNTIMNIVAAGCPALISPFSQNREQALRIERMAEKAQLSMLFEGDLQPERLADNICAALQKKRLTIPAVSLNGAIRSASLLKKAAREMVS